jgi:hypothetical protein
MALLHAMLMLPVEHHRRRLWLPTLLSVLLSADFFWTTLRGGSTSSFSGSLNDRRDVQEPRSGWMTANPWVTASCPGGLSDQARLRARLRSRLAF